MTYQNINKTAVKLSVGMWPFVIATKTKRLMQISRLVHKDADFYYKYCTNANNFRELNKDVPKIYKLLSKFKPKMLLNNTNLVKQTSVQ